MKRIAHSTVLVVSLCVTTLVVLSACGTDADMGDTTTTEGPASILTVEEASRVEPGSTVQVRGALVAPGGASSEQMVLASVLMESYPPQAGGATLGLTGLDVDDLVGLSSSVGEAGVTPVIWSDYWFVLGGIVDGGSLEVKSTPRVISANAGNARTRFSPVSEPVVSGQAVWWAFDIKNEGTAPLRLTLASGQQGDVTLSQDGVEKYRWSAGKMFTQAVEEVTVEPGGVWTAVLNDTLEIAPGEYDLTARVTAVLSGEEGGDSQGAALPELKTTITVY